MISDISFKSNTPFPYNISDHLGTFFAVSKPQNNFIQLTNYAGLGLGLDTKIFPRDDGCSRP